MTIEVSDRPCPECEATLHVVYISELQQVVSGWSCAECGYVESEKHGFRANVPLVEPESYVIRKLVPITSDDVRDPLGDVQGEFRARGSAEMGPDEVWMLVDPDSEDLVDVMYGAEYTESDDESAERSGG